MTRFKLPTPGVGVWFPSLWAGNECKQEELSEEFWLATKPHRKDFEELGFTQCRLAKNKTLNPRIRESGVIGYLDSTRRYFGQMHYIKVLRGGNRHVNEIHIRFTAMFETGSVTCTNNKKYFDTFEESDVTNVDSFDVKFIYQQFLQRIQRRNDAPRTFPDLESLRQWFDARQLRMFEEYVRRRLFLPMTDAEVAAAQERLRSGAPPVLPSTPVGKIRWALWLVILGCLLALHLIHKRFPDTRSLRISRLDTMEYRGQQFKLRKVYATWDDYKEDPNNLDTNELGRIEQIMTNAPVPATFKDSEEFLKFVSFNLVFPGYGEGSFEERADDGSILNSETVEIPQRDKDRVLVAREVDGQVKLVDDFVYNTATNELGVVKLEKQVLRYYDTKNNLLREKHL